MSLNRSPHESKLSAKTAIGLFLAFFIFCYGTYEAWNIISGPVLTISSPANGQIVNDSLIEIKGSTKRIAKIYLNDRQIFAKSDGSFNEPLLLAYGYNIIEVHVSDQFGRQITKTIELVLK